MPDNVASRRTPDYITVNGDGELWAAGVEPGRLQQWERDLHPDYPATASYRALFYAALLPCGMERIERLVTGLPVAQHANPERRNALRERLTGTHQITPKRVVTVDRVDVLPQPVGAYLDFLEQTPDPSTMERARVLVLDFGFFSVDWVVIEGGEVRTAMSGTSTAAMSAILDAADMQISQDHGGAVGREELEKALRNDVSSVSLYGQKVEITPYLTLAARRFSGIAITALRQTMRGERRDIDAVLLAGGGAATYEQAAREAFPKARVFVSEAPVLANARGFWNFAA
jgi:plasmid segregation protein ParM